LHLGGKGRNEIAEILTHSHIRISQGSVTNILRAYKANTGQASTRVTSDFPKVSEPAYPELQTSPMSEMKEQTNHEAVQEESFMDSSWSMVFEQVIQAKKQLRDELLLIEQKKKELEQQRMQVDRARYDLEIREIKLLEAEPLIPIARQLQQMGTDINQFLPWVETIHENAEAWKMDLRTAYYRVAQDLRSYRQLGSIEQAQQRLALLNMFTAQKERALMVLMELQNRGVSLNEIYGLSKILDLDRLGKEWHYVIGQDNGNRNGVNGSSNEFHNFRLDDKLNCVV